MRANNERILAPIILVLMILFFVYKYYEDSQLQKEGFYTLGHVSSASFEGGQGWTYKFSYKVKGQIYFASYNGPVEDILSSDSLVFLRISNNDFSLWRLITDKKAPECVKFNDVPESGWKDIKNVCKP